MIIFLRLPEIGGDDLFHRLIYYIFVASHMAYKDIVTGNLRRNEVESDHHRLLLLNKCLHQILLLLQALSRSYQQNLSACQLFFQLLHGFPVVHIILLIFFIDLFCFVLIVKCLVLLWNRL